MGSSPTTIGELIDLLERFNHQGPAGLKSLGRGFKGTYSTEGMQMYSHGMFGYCGPDEVVGAYVNGHPFSQWIGWTGDRFERRAVKILTSLGPEGPQYTPSSGVMTGKCAECNGVQWEKCEIDMTKGLLCRCGSEIAAVDIDYGYCKEQPVFRVDGTIIKDDAEWQASLAANALSQDLETMLVQGNRANLNETDGLERVVRHGYTDCRTQSACEAVDSILVDWAFDGLNGAVNLHGNIIQKITDIIRRFKLRAKGHGGINIASDVTIMLPTHLRDALVDYWATFGTFLVTGQIAIDATVMFERRESFIKGGLFGDGWVPVDGVPVSLLCNDYIPFGGANGSCSDIYILTRRLGTVITLMGVFQDFSGAGAALASRFGADRFSITDGGRFLVYNRNTQETCFNTCIITRPGLYCSAPWLQARIYDVCVTPQFTPISKMPGSYYFQYSPQSQAVTTDLPCY